MALSVFPHDEECTTPTDLINLVYGGGTYTGLNNLSEGTGTPFFTNGGINIGDLITIPTTCSTGIDVAFLVDYTGSMGFSINGVKAGINNILSTIDAESNGNYRVSLTLFDEYNGTNVAAPSNYNNAIYQSLPSTQKVKIANGTSTTQFITCMEPFSGVGQTSNFQSQLSVLNTSNFPLGSGNGSPEPGGLGVNEIISNGIAGGFRAEAIKIIILITDNIPGGDDDINNSTDQTYFNNTLIGITNSLDVQVMVQSTLAPGTSGNYYYNLAVGTTPVGRYDQVTFDASGNWINSGLIAGIESLCDESYIPTCDSAPAGWYHEYGSTFAFYYDGSTVTNIYYYPPEYALESPTMIANEGGSFTFNAETRYVTVGTTLYWTIDSGSSTNMSNDFTNAANQGQVTIQQDASAAVPQSGKRLFGFTVSNDNLTEGQERFKLHLRTGSYSGPIVASTNWLYINDTSLNPPTATPVPTGNCQNSWISVEVDATRYGLQYRTTGNTTVRTRFNQMLSTANVWLNGKEGYVVSVCSMEVTNVWDFNLNALVALSSDMFSRLAAGGECQINNECVYIAPTPTATPYPTATPIPPTATPIPPTATPYPTATATPYPTATRASSGSGSGPTATPVPPTATPNPTAVPQYNYVVECVSGMCLQGTGRVVSSTTQYSIGQIVTLNNQNGCWEVMPEVSSTTPVSTITGICAPTPTAVPQYTVYRMDPCDGVGGYVYARSNTSVSLYGVYDLTGSGYNSQPYTVIGSITSSSWDTWISSATSCESGDGPGCLLEGSQVKLFDGTQVTIETLQIDQVLASVVVGNMPDTDDSTSLLSWSQVNPTISNTSAKIKDITEFTVDSILKFNNDLIISSKDHLHIVKRNENWTILKAEDVVTGDKFISENGAEILITSITEQSGSFKVYKLDIESNDIFIANGIITHNEKIAPR